MPLVWGEPFSRIGLLPIGQIGLIGCQTPSDSVDNA